MPFTSPSTAPGNARIRRALVAYGLCAFTEFATWLAVLLVAYRVGGPTLLGIASIVMLVPAIILIPLVSGIGDRMPRSRVLSLTHVTIALTSALAGLLLLVEAPIWIVLVVATVLNVALGVARPMHYAILPVLARAPGELVRANGASASLDGAALFIGFLSAGFLTDVLGAWVVMLSCAGLSAIAALLAEGLRTVAVEIDEDDVGSRIREATAGAVALRRNPGALPLLLLIAVMSVVEGANDTLTVTFNDQVLGLTESGAGLLAGAYGLGVALGGVVLASAARMRRLAPVVLAGTVLMGLMQSSVSLAADLWPALILLTLVGMGVAMIEVSGRTLLQRSTDDAVLARVLGLHEAIVLFGLTLGAVVGPILVATVGPERAFIPLGVLVGVLGLVFFARIRVLDAHARLRTEEIELLSRIEFLAALRPFDLERLAQRSTWRDAPAGTTVITQGAVGDSYYVVAAGELSVTTDGRLRSHTMTEGEGFGEIALLQQVPRTATVTATTDSRLLRITAADFLATVVPNMDGVRLARAVGEERRRSDDEDEGGPAGDATVTG